MSRMNFKRQTFYSISIFVFLLSINIRQINPFPSEPLSDNHSIELQSMLEDRAYLINELPDRLRQLNNLVEEYGNLLTGKEENVLNLVTEVKELWENLKEMTNKQIAEYMHFNLCSEEQKQEAELQDATAIKLKDDVFATLFNAKGRRCKSGNEAFYEPLSKCFEIGESCPDGHPNQLFYELEGTNEGICDCKDETGMVFHNQTGECYQLNTQGPCKTGEWLIYNSSLGIKDNVTCELVPDKECKLDGSQVFYEDQCETLGYNGDACNGMGILERNSDDWGIFMCSFGKVPILRLWPYFIHRPIGESVPLFACPAKSKRALNNQCRPIFKHGISQK